MSSKSSTVEFLLDQLVQAGNVTAKKMFGEYGLYYDGKLTALVCDDQLFVKITPAGRAFLGEFPEGRAYPGAKPMFLISGGLWDDRDWLSNLIKISAADLPKPAKKSSPAKR